MIIEMRTYTIKTGQVNKLIELYKKEGMSIHRRILGNQIGFFYSEIGDLNQIVHLYGYKSLDDRSKRRNELSNNKDWKKYLTKATDLIISQKSQLLYATDFSKIK